MIRTCFLVLLFLGIIKNASALTITVTAITPSVLCAGQPLSATFSVAGGAPVAGNVYTLQLSDPAGAFTAPVSLATLTSTALTGTFNMTLPQGVPSGTGYRLRVNASAPATTGTASASAFTVNGILGDIPSPATFRYCGSSGGRDYFVSTATQDWTQSQALCAAAGGHLAYIPDTATNRLLTAHAGTGAYIGYTDQAIEGVWQWLNSAPATFIAWAPGEPNNSGNEDYAQLTGAGGWNDIPGTFTQYALLQLAPATSNSPVCEGSTITLNAFTLSGATYSWAGPNGFTSAQQNPQITNAVAASAGTYTLTYTKGGCTATATVAVTVNPAATGIGQNSPLLPSLTSGLVLYYPFNGNATDASGNNLNGAVYGGVTPAADRFGNPSGAMKMDGFSGYVDAPDGVYFNGSDFTVTAWIKTASNGNSARVFDFANGQANNNVLLTYTSGTNGMPSATVYNGTTLVNYVFSNATQTPLNQWAHLALTFSSGIGSIYINGVRVAQGNLATPQNVLRTLNYIGRSQWVVDAYADATFDEFRIYNRALTTTELMSLVLQQPDPVGFVAASGSVCSGSTATLYLLNSQPGVSYQLQNASNGSNIGTPLNGNGDTLVFVSGIITAPASFQLQATTVSGGCVRTFSPPVTISIAPLPAAPAVTGAQRCGPGQLTLTASGAPLGGYYQWYTTSTGGTPIAGVTTSTYTTPSLNTTTTYYVSVVGTCESARTPVTATILSVTGPLVDLHSNLIAYYKLDGNLADSSGYNNPMGYYYNFAYVADRNANAASAVQISGGNFLGCNNTPVIQQLNTEVTVALWINEMATNYGFLTPLVNKWQNDGLYMGLESYYDVGLQQQMNRVRWRVNANNYVLSSVNVPHGTWHHIVCTFGGGRLKVYQNGVLTGDIAEAGVITNTTLVSLEIGRQANGSGNTTYYGSLDDIRIYSRAFNADEAQALYNESSIAFANDPLCEGQTLLLTAPAIPGATYAWTGPNGFTSNQQNPAPVTNVTTANAGTYSLVINNANGCVSPPQQNVVIINPLPGAPVTTNDTVCGSGNAILSASGGSSYAWYSNASGGTALSNAPTYTLNNVTATDTLWVSAFSASGCEGPRTPVIAVFNNPIQNNLTAAGSTACQGNTGTVVIQNAQAGVNYQAYFNNAPVSNPVSGTGSLTIPVTTTAMNAGANTITIIASQNGCGTVTLTDTATLFVLANPVPTVTASGSLNMCQGGQVTLTASPGSSYLWSNGDTAAATTITQQGIYTVTVTSPNGCAATSAPVNVTVNPLPQVTFSMPQSVYCLGDSPMLLTGGSPAGGTYSGPGVTGNMFTPAQAGTGTFTLTYHFTDLNGCADSAGYTVTVDVCSGLQDLPGKNNGLLIFPNPAGAQLTLQWNTTATGMLLIYDVTGRVVDQHEVRNANHLELAVSDYAAGTYYAALETSAGTMRTRFIKK